MRWVFVLQWSLKEMKNIESKGKKETIKPYMYLLQFITYFLPMFYIFLISTPAFIIIYFSCFLLWQFLNACIFCMFGLQFLLYLQEKNIDLLQLPSVKNINFYIFKKESIVYQWSITTVKAAWSNFFRYYSIK